MKRSLGALLALCLAGLQFLAVIAVVSSSFVTSERALIQHARDLLRDVAYNASAHSQGFLSPAAAAADLAARLAQNRVIASEDAALLERLLFQQLQTAPNFAGIYFGSERGHFVMVMRTPEGPAPFRSKIITGDGGSRRVEMIWRRDDFTPVARELDPTDTFDPRDRPWYERASIERATIWTDPYIFFSSKNPGITLASPVFNEDGSLRGAIGVDIEIQMISDFLSRLNIGATGKALIMNHNGDVIAHPDPDLIRATATDGTLHFANISEFGDPIAKSAFGGLPGSAGIQIAQEKASEFQFEGARYVSYLMPILSEKLPWTIAVYAPEDDFTGVIKENRAVNLWIAGGVALVTGLLGLILARRINRPVRAFGRISAQLAQSRMEGPNPADRGQKPQLYSELEAANETLAREIIARREVEREFGQTFEMSARGMAQVSAQDGSIMRANQRFAEILGAEVSDLVGLKLHDMAHPDDQDELLQVGEEDQPSNAPNLDMRWIRRDGKEIWVRLNSILIRGNRGEMLHGIWTVDDITEEKARDRQIAQLNRDLSHLARGNTMGQMASGLAHELNQPLAAIAQNADAVLVALDQRGEDDPELREIMAEIERQSLRAGDIIRALRGFIRKDDNKRVTFEFDKLVAQTLGLVKAEAGDANVSIITDLGEDLPLVQANRVQIAQILVNLLRNGIDALRADPNPDPFGRRIVLSARANGRGIEVAVWDNGPGIDPALRLFQQFETTKHDGMGLGLSICRSLIEANGGRIWHDHNPGRGACFRFTLPLQGAQA